MAFKREVCFSLFVYCVLFVCLFEGFFFEISAQKNVGLSHAV